MTTATHDHIVHHFLELMASPERDAGNWGTGWDNSRWWVTDETHINGIVLYVDLDYQYGWLLEIRERGGGRSYLAVAAFHGPKRDSDGDMISWQHDSLWFEGDATNVWYDEASAWAVSVIYEMIKEKDELDRRQREQERGGE
jgi:hypothetical protein